MEGGDLAVFSTADGPRAVDKVRTKDKKVALTFDISWGESRAIPILEVLKQKNVKNTTFFLSGAWAERHPDTVETIIENGHELASMGYRYKNYTEMEDEEIRKDIVRAQEAIEKISDEVPTLLRPPNGNFDKRVLNISGRLKQTVVHWSLDSEDWQNPGTDKIIENVTENVRRGDIILLHASDSAKQTAAALPVIIDKLKDDGYTFVSVTELIADTKAKSKEVK
ncbi:polysaccharide deacetylase family sporulation protein PdaB [Pseudalkalibacillus caeni]|uniref:Polysaccharide deacetylase family sporulation protein PdaB n=2 Tax=Exobacillus caeni TaxID=2574798 RepID=A0A5R9EZK9_9BACL|nr:polysaccharide deacetylase family sporulation protein PdaB [Pseudalkalibacillus caeni]